MSGNIPFGAKFAVCLEVAGDIIHLDGGKTMCGHHSWLADRERMPMLVLITLLQAILTLLYKQASCLPTGAFPQCHVPSMPAITMKPNEAAI